MSRHCIHITIDRALSMTDEQLQYLCSANPSAIRDELEARKEKGELLIGSANCEGFSPITGCPGHENTT